MFPEEYTELEGVITLASPAVFDDKIVFASRGGKIHQVKIK